MNQIAEKDRPSWGVWRLLKWLLLAIVVWVLLLFSAGRAVEEKVPVLLPFRIVFTGSWDNGFAGAEGTWVIENAKSAAPFQTSTISCSRAEAICREARAQIVNGNYLAVDLDEYKVVKWDAQTIIYTSDSPTCVRYTYTIDRASEIVSGVRALKSPDEPLCAELDTRLVLRLEDGLEVHRNRPVSAVLTSRASTSPAAD